MKIGVIGHNYTHGADFVMNYPKGPGCYLFLLVKSPARFLLNGKKLRLEKNTILFFTPHTACRYAAENGTYTDDWFYCNMTPEEELTLRNEGMPFDTPMQTQNAAELSELIRKMAYEHYSAELMHSEIEQQYANILFMKIRREYNAGDHHSTLQLRDNNQQLTYLRMRIYQTPEQFSTVDSMLNFVSMSRSGLQHLYKKTFGVTVMTDVTCAKMQRAKELLSSTGLTVGEIAEQCGYGCTYSFLRQFKKNCGSTPSDFRKQGRVQVRMATSA